MNAINKLKLSLSAVLFSFLGIACSDIDDNLVNYPVVAEVNTVYYIDSESGNDANSGESESSAWKTFANINRVIFQAGNRIACRTRTGAFPWKAWKSQSGSVHRVCGS